MLKRVNRIFTLGVILGALVEALIALLGSPERTPRHRTLLLLDELANLGTLTELERGVSYLQGSGVQLMACVQNLPQLVSLYGPQSPLLASIHTQVHYRPLDRLTSEYLEAMLGPQTVMAQSWGETQGISSSGFSSSRSAGQHETGRPLLTAAELRALPADSALVLASGCPPVLARKLGVRQPAVATRVLRIANAHREATATLAAAAALLVALIPALAPVVQPPPGLRPQPTLVQAPPRTQAPVFSTSATAPPTASSPTATVTQAASRAPAWRIYMREPYHRAGQYSPTLARDFPTRDACVQAMLDGAEPLLRALHNAGSQKVFNYTLDVDTTQPDRLTWTVNYHGKSKLGGAPLNPDNAPDVHERWCAEEQKG